MWMICNLIILFAAVQRSFSDNGYIVNNKKFPSNFMFGTATSAYQVEGAWNIDGKGESIWDNFTHTHPELILDGKNADITCDSYHKYKDDVAMLKYLGVNHYRFSISWNRILSNGLPNQINEAGIKYYKNLIRELKANNIEPFVTIYHWDLPQALQDLGGFLSDDFPKWFADYSRVVFDHFGDDITYWVTFNEPSVVCSGYGTGPFAPALDNPGVGEYLCMHNLLKAHANAYHIYKTEFSSKRNGKLGMAHLINYCAPKTNSTADIAASEQKMIFWMGWVANPIYYGDYPEIMKSRIANRSKAEGFAKSRLPDFTEEEKELLKNTSDYIGVNVYWTCNAFAIEEPKIELPPSVEKDDGVGIEWAQVGDGTSGMTDLLRWISKEYNNPDIIITENGWGTPAESSSSEDDDRISKIKNSLSRFRDAMDDNITVIGYTQWSLMDNLEWYQGYTQKLGLFEVDLDSPNKTRTPRKSAKWYKKLIETRCLTDKCE